MNAFERGYMKNLKLHEVNFLLMPINLSGNHWALLVFDIVREHSYLLNSIKAKHYKSKAKEISDAVGRWMTSTWKTEIKFQFHELKVPKQPNTWDCGVYIVKYCLEFLKMYVELGTNFKSSLIGSIYDGMSRPRDVKFLFEFFPHDDISKLRYDILSSPKDPQRQIQRAQYKAFITHNENLDMSQTQEIRKGMARNVVLSEDEEKEEKEEGGDSKKGSMDNFLDVEVESDWGISDEHEDGEGGGSFIVSDHESIPETTTQVGSKEIMDGVEEKKESSEKDELVYDDKENAVYTVDPENNVLLYYVEHCGPLEQREERIREILDLADKPSIINTEGIIDFRRRFNIPRINGDFTNVWNISMLTKKKRKSTIYQAITILNQ